MLTEEPGLGSSVSGEFNLLERITKAKLVRARITEYPLVGYIRCNHIIVLIGQVLDSGCDCHVICDHPVKTGIKYSVVR
jgi:ribosomal protein L18E